MYSLLFIKLILFIYYLINNSLFLFFNAYI